MSEPRMNSRKQKSKSTSIEGPSEPVQSLSGLKDQNPDDEPKKKRSRFTFEEKKKILEESNDQTTEYICEEYKIHCNTLMKWKAKREQIYEAALNSSTVTKKKMINISEELDNALHSWLLNSVSSETPVTGPMIQRKALILNAELGGNPDFKASHGWLDKWKQRNNVRNKMITGEKLSADPVAAAESKETFKKITIKKQLSRSQWFNMDESGLQYGRDVESLVIESAQPAQSATMACHPTERADTTQENSYATSTRFSEMSCDRIVQMTTENMRELFEMLDQRQEQRLKELEKKIREEHREDMRTLDEQHQRCLAQLGTTLKRIIQNEQNRENISI